MFAAGFVELEVVFVDFDELEEVVVPLPEEVVVPLAEDELVDVLFEFVEFVLV